MTTGSRSALAVVIGASADCSANGGAFVFDNQMLAQVLWNGATIAEVNCPTRYDPESSSIDLHGSVVYRFGCLGTALGYWLAKTALVGSPPPAPRRPVRFPAL